MKPTEMAPPRGLTPKFIESLRPAEKAYEVPDRAAPGLRLRVLPSGKKTFRWEVSALCRVITIGKWAPEPTPGHVTLQEAHRWLERLKTARVAGREQLEAVVRELEQEVTPRQVELVPPSPQTSNPVRAVVDAFYTLRIKDVRKTHLQVLSVLNNDIVPVLGPETDIAAITPRHCSSVVETVLARGARAQAGFALDILKQFFRWAAATGYVTANPAHLLTRDTYGLEKSHRERNLSGDELRMFWSTLDADEEARKCALALQLILVTGVRKNELCRAEWTYVDFEAATWTIPVEHRKKSRKQARLAKPFIIPLPPLGVELMKELLELAGDSPFVLPGSSPSKHHTGGGLLAFLQRRFGSPSTPARVALPSGPISVHDLRRTMRTKLGELDVSPDIAERCINHSRRDPYDQGDYLPQRREALEKWASFIEQLVVHAEQKRAA